MKISIGFEKAPKKPLKYLLNGISANTMFYLINKEKMDSIEFIEKRDYNHLDIPYDNDDLSRCVDASYDASVSNGFSKEVVEAQNLVREYLKR